MDNYIWTYSTLTRDNFLVALIYQQGGGEGAHNFCVRRTHRGLRILQEVDVQLSSKECCMSNNLAPWMTRYSTLYAYDLLFTLVRL